MNKDNILLTEDGHPIGEVVIADGANVPPVRPTSEIVAENREALLRSEAQELTGDPDADTAIADLYPGYSDVDKRKQALTLFVAEHLMVDEIAEKVGVPPRTVSQWMFVGHWDAMAKREIAAQRSQSILELERLRSKRRLEVAKEQLEQAKAIRERAMENIETDQGGSLKSNTEAWAAAAKIEHTLTGVSETGSVAGLDGSDDEKKKQNDKQPLVMVFQGGLPPIRKANQ